MSQPPPDEPMLSAGIASHLRNTPPTDACPDAETLAVYAEGAASAAERSRVEAHLASCLRCQSHIIVLVGTAPAEGAAAAPGAIGGFGFPWRWLVPVTAAALIVLAVWVNQPTSPAPSRIAVGPPIAEEPTAATPRDSQTYPAAPQSAATPPPEDAAPRASREGASKPAAPPRREADRGAQMAPDTLAKGAPGASAEIAGLATGVEARAQAPPQATDRLAPPAPPSAAAAPAASSAFAPPDVCRLVDGGVERWAKGEPSARGARFEPEGVTFRAVAGTSPTLCWAVGAEGAVFRVTDGATWARVPFPERVELTAIGVTDVDRAVVTTADGRRFATDDAGSSWRVLPPH